MNRHSEDWEEVISRAIEAATRAIEIQQQMTMAARTVLYALIQVHPEPEALRAAIGLAMEALADSYTERGQPLDGQPEQFAGYLRALDEVISRRTK